MVCNLRIIPQLITGLLPVSDIWGLRSTLAPNAPNAVARVGQYRFIEFHRETGNNMETGYWITDTGYGILYYYLKGSSEHMILQCWD